jgi:methylmalonyl-CoA mutase N-terminal domain/subunit
MDESAAPAPGFRTHSGLEVKAHYTADDVGDPEGLGAPGSPPFTRGINKELYRSAPWVMGQYSGYSSPQRTNARFKQLLAAGQTGFSIALDLPTQMGLDSDHPRSLGEVGKVGVPIDSLADMEDLLDGIELRDVRQIRTSANSIGPIIAAMFIAAAEAQGTSPNDFRVMFQNDSLKEYLARGTYIFPPRHGLRFSADVIEYCARHIPRWEPIEFCGYHIRDSGCDAIDEVAIAVANGLEYLRETRRRGLEVRDFAGGLYLFLSADTDIFEEAAKFRAARRLWYRLLEETFPGEVDDVGIPIFCYTLGGSLVASEPENNIVRVAYQALAAALGGVQTIASSSYDEALGLPSEHSVHLSLRTQQILAFETGVTSVVDPLGGSYYVENLTDRLEAAMRAEVDKIEGLGGAVAALENGYLEELTSTSAYEHQQALERGTRRVVGLNHLTTPEPPTFTTRPVRSAADGDDQVVRVRRIRQDRDEAQVSQALEAVRRAARDEVNSLPSILDAVRCYSTVGEICAVLREEWGSYIESGRF